MDAEDRKEIRLTPRNGLLNFLDFAAVPSGAVRRVAEFDQNNGYGAPPEGRMIAYTAAFAFEGLKLIGWSTLVWSAVNYFN